MPVPTGLVFNAQWDAIVSLLQAQMNVDNSGNPGKGTNTSGTLQSVKFIDKSIWPEFNSLPYIGVQLETWSEEDRATTRQHQVVSTFKIIVVVSVQPSGASQIKLSDAMTALVPLIDDGNGNGIIPILGSSANQYLNGTAFKTLTSGGTIDWAKNPAGKGTDYIAYALLGFKAWQLVQRL